MPAIIPLAISAGSAIYSAVSQKNAASKAAAIDQSTADYNARVDETMGRQLDLDTLANIRTARQEGRVYLSRQAASYAAAGVLTDTGSPLHAQITTAGRLEQQVQQQYQNSLNRQQQYAAAAKAGRMAGAAQATTDNARGTLALVDGGAKIAGQLYHAYDSGVFSSTPAGG